MKTVGMVIAAIRKDFFKCGHCVGIVLGLVIRLSHV